MAYPKITYTQGGTAQTLNFKRTPPRNLPAFVMQAVRHDNVASSGVREAVLERIDNFLEFSLEWIDAGADVAAWNAFLQFALAGGQFSYYPDSSLFTFTNYWLEDTSQVAEHRSPGEYTFKKLRFRQVVT